MTQILITNQKSKAPEAKNKKESSFKMDRIFAIKRFSIIHPILMKIMINCPTYCLQKEKTLNRNLILKMSLMFRQMLKMKNFNFQN